MAGIDVQAGRMGAQGRARRGAASVPRPPQGAQSRLRWLGPGFLWMVSAAGSGELLFTPRIGSLYGYSLIWALLAAVACKWFINREVGRYAVCTGAPILEGFKQLPGPRNWAVWLIIVPQIVVAISAIAGLASSSATAAVLVLPGPLWLWTLVIIGAAASFVLWGRYGLIEKAATVLGLALAVAAVVTAATVFPNPGALASGLVPQVPQGVDIREVLPWLGFALSGAAGIMWYSYWLPPKGYGVAGSDEVEDQDTPIDPKQLDEAGRKRLKGWLTQLTLDNSVAVVGTLIIVLGFLILGVELLRPQGLVPAEDRIAEVLGGLLGQIWGPFGYWFMIAAVGIAFFSTTLSNQDGWARLLSNGTGIIARGLGLGGRWADEGFLRKLFLIGLLAVIPVGVFLLFGNPVALLQLAGAIEAAHLPVLAGLTLYVNYRSLPNDLRPSLVTTGFTMLSALFFAAFASVYLYAAQGELSFAGAVAAGIAGSVLGQLPLYYLGRLAGEERLKRWADKYGAWLTVSHDEIERAKGWFDKHGGKAVLFCRLIPGVRSLISIPAGMAKMNLVAFLLYSTVGMGVWALALAWLGHVLGENYELVSQYLGPVTYIVLGALLLGG